MPMQIAGGSHRLRTTRMWRGKRLCGRRAEEMRRRRHSATEGERVRVDMAPIIVAASARSWRSCGAGVHS